MINKPTKTNEKQDEKLIDKYLNEIKHQFKILDEKIKQTESSIKYEVLKEAMHTRKDLERTLTAEMRVVVRESEERLDIKLTKFADKMYSRIDPILAEVEDARVDRELATENMRKIEKRVQTLEKAVN